MGNITVLRYNVTIENHNLTMGGDTMKKRIVSILTFLLIAICLTGCANTRISTARIQEFTEIAQNIKDNPNYTLPEGFTFKPETKTQNGRIVITVKGETNKKYLQKATFDMTQEKVQLEKIEEDYSTDILEVFIILVIILLIAFILITY